MFQLFNLRKASVAIILFKRNDTHHVLLTKRASSLRTHKGQVSFPGGRQDQSDSNTDQIDAETECALRETEEELGIPRNKLKTIDHKFSIFKILPLLFNYRRKIQVTPLIFELDKSISEKLPTENTKFTSIPGAITVNPDEVEYAFHSKLSNFGCPGLESFWMYNYNTTMITMKPDGEELRVWGFTAGYMLDLYKTKKFL